MQGMIMEEFMPTYLYIKRHTITGLCYLGKTTGTEQYLLEDYNGGGDYWGNHIKKHGKEFVETPWYCLFTEKEELVKFALMCSAQWNIVESKSWANLMPENGLDGFPPGLDFSDEHIKHLSEAKQGKTWEDIYGEEGAKLKRLQNSAPKGPMKEERKKNISLSKKGMDAPHNWDTISREKVSMALKGIKKPEGFSEKLQAASRVVKTCPHCGISGTGPSMQRWHFQHCKFRKI